MMGDPYNYPGGGAGDYRDDLRMMERGQQQQQQGRPNYDGRDINPNSSSYYGSADSQTWWDDKK
jgi:hypothetical protein